MENQSLTIFTDGGSRGNPGLSACAFIVKDAKNQTLYQQGVVLGIHTNNYAEYQGVLAAYKYLHSQKTQPSTVLNFNLDSELVVKQLTGKYRIKDPQLSSLANDIKYYEKYYLNVSYRHIFRNLNQFADLLVNRTLDQF